jgi:hypothetical protein
MSRRFKPYLFVILITLIISFVMGPPVAFATKLPKACNIFNKTQIEKSGPCGHQALFSNDKSVGNEVLFSSGVEFGNGDCLLFQNIFSPLSVPSVTSSKSAAPLRC